VARHAPNIRTTFEESNHRSFTKFCKAGFNIKRCHEAKDNIIESDDAEQAKLYIAPCSDLIY